MSLVITLIIFCFHSSHGLAIPPGGLKGLKNKVGVTIRLSIKGDEVSLSSASSTQKV